MFQSYSLSSNDKFTITDSDFQELLVNNKTYWVEYIIEVYSKRNLNVALNLFLFMQYRDKLYNSSTDDQISSYKKNVKDFDKYLPEINKYLALI